MHADSKRSWLRLGLLCAPVLLILSACAAADTNAGPTLSLNAISTSAFQTFTVEMATKQALAPPTDTPAPAPSQFPTLALASPLPTFALSSSTPALGGVSDCDNAAYIADVTVPDKTQFDSGKKFVKTWLVQNTGTCPWNTNYKVVFLDGEEMGGTEAYVRMPVPVGQQVELSVDLKAPTSSGYYYSRWQLQNDKSQPFGSILTVVIKVVNPFEQPPTATP